MSQESVDRRFRADHEVYYSLGQARDMQQLEQQARGKRHPFRGLQHESIAARDGIWQKPQRDHRREIKRGDGNGHAQRLANHDFVDAAGHILQVVALHQRRDSAGYLDIFNAALQLSPGLGQSLAVFPGDHARNIIGVLDQKIPEPE